MKTDPRTPASRISTLTLALVATLASGPVAAAPRADITVLPTFGGTYGGAEAINNNGQVVGRSTNSAEEYRGFLWQSGSGMQDLGYLGSGFLNGIYDINNGGQVVGFRQNSSGETRAFLWQYGSTQDLGNLGVAYSEAYGINDTGQVVGWSYNSAGEDHAFLWQSGSIQDLGTLGGSSSRAYGINNAGQVVGESTNSAGENHAFLWQSGSMQDLGTLGGSSSVAYDINDAGQAVGKSTNSAGEYRGFLWQSGSSIQDLGTLGGTESYANAINNAGQVVGESSDSAGSWHIFLWRNGVMTDLDRSFPGSVGFAPTKAKDINEYAQVVGRGFDTTTLQFSGYVLTLHPDWEGGDGYWDDTVNPHWNWAGTGTAAARIGFMHDVVIDPGNKAIVYGSADGKARSITIGGSGFYNVLDLNGGATTSGTVLLRDGGGLQGEGILEADITFEAGTTLLVGGIGSGGIMELYGTLSFDDTTEIFMDLNSDTDYDTLYTGDIEAFQPVALNGADLWVTWNGGLFSFAAGDEFKLFDWATGVTGTFDIMGLPNLDPGLRWDLINLYNTGVLRVSAVPVPAAVWLFGSGLVGLVAVARRHRA